MKVSNIGLCFPNQGLVRVIPSTQVERSEKENVVNKFISSLVVKAMRNSRLKLISKFGITKRVIGKTTYLFP